MAVTWFVFPEVIKPRHDLVQYGAAADDGIVQAGNAVNLTSNVIRCLDAANRRIDAGSDRRDAVLGLAAQTVEIVAVDGAVLIGLLDPFLLAVVSVLFPPSPFFSQNFAAGVALRDA